MFSRRFRDVAKVVAKNVAKTRASRKYDFRDAPESHNYIWEDIFFLGVFPQWKVDYLSVVHFLMSRSHRVLKIQRERLAVSRQKFRFS